MSTCNASIGELAEIIRGVTYDKTDARGTPSSGYLPLLRATNIEAGRLSFDSPVFVPTSVVSDAQMLRPGDIVIAASSGSLSVVGKAALLHNSWIGTFGAFCYVVRPKGDLVLPEYLAHFMQTSEYRGCVSNLAAGVNINNLRRQHIQGIRIPYISPQQQRLTVDALDSLLSRLDVAVTSLEQAQAKLKVCRASVLKAAIDGRLVPTEAELARKERRDYERADVLLARILKERRLCWEETQIGKMKTAGKIPKDDKWEKKYEEPAAPDTSDRPKLPEGWCWATTDQLFSFVTSGSRGWAKYYSESGAAFIRIGNLDHDSISLDLSEIQHVSPPRGSEGTRTRVAPGDLLISITADVGMIGVVPDQINEAYINQHIGLARPVRSFCIPYLAWFLAATHGGQRQFLSLQRGATKVGLGLDDIRMVNVPLPPLAEQQRIVDEIERYFSVAAGCQAAIATNALRTQRLRQAILKWAFQGKLVDPDPAEKPAATLLERLRTEHAAAGPAKKARNRRLKVAS